MNANLQHRPATAADLGEVVGFPQNAEELFFCYPKAVWPLNVGQLAAAIAERRDSTVVELGGRIAGFANFYQWQHGEFCALGNLMVAPWARGQGVAQYLVEVMENLARERYKVPLMKVSCFNANAGGLLLYSRLGYNAVGIVERRAPDGSRVALVQLEKPLP
ncbi:GNAT family N-acetyltransferase [Ectopseudomonas hydrolytica]|uniref:GNAT family N-acetyltransferase n=1 Tax=Ectopseudomonas hydrolytica TaxID=2493633 RepID=A0ABY5A9P1_9GAMM|nr:MULTISPECIES: GNAT family N-acetyltransferase [Pseudomonas]MDH0097915.1 GNAT family N-acetyltransferase [Pseudomonas sp. GD04158]USR40583.1 GNAT family N-acetyltransferase [Pseudomonas hydrolytica]